MAKANQIFQGETMVHLHDVGNLFDEIIKTSEDHILTDDVMIEEAQKTKEQV